MAKKEIRTRVYTLRNNKNIRGWFYAINTLWWRFWWSKYISKSKLNEIIDHTRPILYIPLAMNEEEHSYDSCYEWIQGELANVDIPYIEMVRTFEKLASIS